jgi:hypothetical protein
MSFSALDNQKARKQELFKYCLVSLFPPVIVYLIGVSSLKYDKVTLSTLHLCLFLRRFVDCFLSISRINKSVIGLLVDCEM